MSPDWYEQGTQSSNKHWIKKRGKKTLPYSRIPAPSCGMNGGNHHLASTDSKISEWMHDLKICT